MVTFIDLAGHEKYLKTTVFGMTGHAPDFSMLMASFSTLYFVSLNLVSCISSGVGGATGRALDLRSTGHVFKFYSRQKL